MFKNNQGVSAVISTIILIALVLVVIGIVYMFVLPMIEDRVKYSEACSIEILDKIEINSLSCYDKDNGNIDISINVRDVETDEILVSVEVNGESRSFKIEQGKNSGRVYSKNLINDLGFAEAEKPSSIKIAPIIDGEQCNEIDSLNNIIEC